LTHDEAAQRVVNTWSGVKRLEFVLVHLIAEGELVSIVYECHIELLDGRSTVSSSMEVYRVVDGRICEVWNVGHAEGAWR